LTMSTLPHPEPISGTTYSAVELMPDDERVVMLDQRRLPNEEVYVVLKRAEEIAEAIRDMVVRGAPAIGIAAAYAMALAARSAKSDYLAQLERAALGLKAARPTAVNLGWAVDRCLGLGRAHAASDWASRAAEMAELARSIHRDDVSANRIIGRLGAERVPDDAVILTHCNAGALATGGYGTALGVVRAAFEAGKRVRVLADETRPYLQGSRLTAWELMRDGISVELITDSSAGSFFAQGAVDLVVVGSDRIAKNGDVANKIGTYSVAVLAHHHERPFFVAAPFSTFDGACSSGARIPIEQRAPAEITELGSTRLAPIGVSARNPAFDVTPAGLVTAIFTERGVVEPVGAAAIAELSGAAVGQ
jgi:methylthioribose-1-phosphate isomerase